MRRKHLISYVIRNIEEIKKIIYWITKNLPLHRVLWHGVVTDKSHNLSRYCTYVIPIFFWIHNYMYLPIGRHVFFVAMSIVRMTKVGKGAVYSYITRWCKPFFIIGTYNEMIFLRYLSKQEIARLRLAEQVDKLTT